LVCPPATFLVEVRGVYRRGIKVSGFFEVLYLSVESAFVGIFATKTTTTSCGIPVATAARTVRSCEQGVVEKTKREDRETEE